MSKFQSLFNSVLSTQADYNIANANYLAASKYLAGRRANDVLESSKGDLQKSARKARNTKYIGAAAGA